MDYFEKNNYGEYNEELRKIPDNPTLLPEIHNNLKAAFKDRKTRTYEFRIQQLETLKQGFAEMKDELCLAIEKDLGKGAFFAYISELHLIQVDIQHTIDHLR